MKPRVLLDSSFWIEWLSKGTRYRSCQGVFEGSTVVGVPTVIVFEVCKKISIKMSSDLALSVASVMRQFGSLPLTDEIALYAVDLSIEWKLGMADSLVLAHAKHEEASLITFDNDFRSIPGAKVL